MNVLYITYLLNGLLMVAMPIGLAVFLVRKFGLDGRLFWIGLGTFILSQIGHIPFVAYVPNLYNKLVMVHLSYSGQLIFTACFAGLSAGLFEEFFRYGMYRWWARDARSWSKGLLLGAGHGGVEAILFGLLVLAYYINMCILRGSDISTLVAADQVAQVTQQVQVYWSAPWYLTLLGAVERLFAIPVHLAMSVVVLQALTRKRFWWVWAAVVFHALLDGVVVYASQQGFSALAIEGIAGIFAVLSVIIIFLLRTPEPLPATEPTLAPVSVAPVKPVEETPENLDGTRFQ
jgi:uncharacterized membrane protein YhfC